MEIISFNIRGFFTLLILQTCIIIIFICSPSTFAQNMCYHCSGKQECKSPYKFECDWKWAACWQYLNEEKEVEHMRCVAQYNKPKNTVPCETKGNEYSCTCRGDLCNGKNLVTGESLNRKCFACEGREQCKIPSLVDCEWPESSCTTEYACYNRTCEVTQKGCDIIQRAIFCGGTRSKMKCTCSSDGCNRFTY